MNAILNVCLVALGSAVGGALRYLVGVIAFHVLGTSFPWGTFAINISGSLLLGWVLTMLGEFWSFDPGHVMGKEQWRLLIAVGFTGGYTTFSSFEHETYSLLREGMAWSAIFYVAGSVFVGLLAFRAGMLIAGGQ